VAALNYGSDPPRRCFDYRSMTISDDVARQEEQYLRTIGQALRQSGGSSSDVVRVHCILPDRRDFEPCRVLLRRDFGEERPAVAMIGVGRIDPRVKIEIEVTARREAT
jgi:enamine deaminase RidA (YjgF/YER057c/UK114 family)